MKQRHLAQLLSWRKRSHQDQQGYRDANKFGQPYPADVRKISGIGNRPQEKGGQDSEIHVDQQCDQHNERGCHGQIEYQFGVPVAKMRDSPFGKP